MKHERARDTAVEAIARIEKAASLAASYIAMLHGSQYENQSGGLAKVATAYEEAGLDHLAKSISRFSTEGLDHVEQARRSSALHEIENAFTEWGETNPGVCLTLIGEIIDALTPKEAQAVDE